MSEPTSPTLTYTEAKEIVKAWRKDFRLGVGDEYVIKAFLDTEAELKTLRAQLTAATARAGAAEAKLAAVPDYAAYYATAWETFEANSDGPEPLDFAEWLAARAEVLP